MPEAEANEQTQKLDSHLFCSLLSQLPHPRPSQWLHSPLQFMDLLGQDMLLCPGQVPATPKLSHFLPNGEEASDGR